MVLDYYNLAEQPFGVTPDPRYLYLSPTHREAMASALYGVRSGRGFTALIAEPGMGKTTLLFDLLQKIRNHAKTVFLFQSQYSPQDLLRSLLADLGIDDDGSDCVRMHRRLNEVLVSESSHGKRLVVVLDEAQNLDQPVFEMVRMLSNFETPREKLMHLVLAGQPLLAEKLATPRLVQLRQRISIISRLKPFSEMETGLYIDHRLRVAGYDFARPLFAKEAQELIASHAGGIPRNINNICFNAMSLGCVAKQKSIEADVVREVLADLDLRPMLTAATASTEKPKTPVLSLPVHKSVPSPLRTWTLRFALAFALVAAVSWPLVRMKRQGINVLASPVSHTAGNTAAVEKGVPEEPNQEPAAVPAPDSSPSNDSRLIVVQPNETLCGISIQNVGKCDQEILARFHELNPWLSNPDHIEIGQRIQVPSISSESQAILPSAERLPGALDSGAEKP